MGFGNLQFKNSNKSKSNGFRNHNKEYIDKGIVKFEHHGSPLDLAALNAEIIVRCHADNNKSFHLLDEIYKKQSQWAVGSDINIINESIKKIGLDSGLSNNKMNDCLNSEIVQDEIKEIPRKVSDVRFPIFGSDLEMEITGGMVSRIAGVVATGNPGYVPIIRIDDAGIVSIQWESARGSTQSE